MKKLIACFLFSGWKKEKKETGFFFLPVSLSTEMISTGRCSEMDIVMDLWLTAVYNDPQMQGSEIGPVTYLCNGTGNPLMTYSELGTRWGVSKANMGRVLKKLSDAGYISLMTLPG